jgi:hypothetical protein
MSEEKLNPHPPSEELSHEPQDESLPEYPHLSEAIAKGIEEGFFSIVNKIVIGIAIYFAIAFLIMAGLSLYDKYTHDKCIERGECIDYSNVTIAYSSSPDSSSSPIARNQPILCIVAIGNSSFTQNILQFSVPSYTEANEKYKTMQYEINETLTVSDWYDKGLTCSD